MPVAHVKEGAVMAQFEASPKRLDAVGVCLPVHTRGYAVLHRAMLAVHALLGCRLARLCRFAPPSWSSPGRSLVGSPCRCVQQSLHSPCPYPCLLLLQWQHYRGASGTPGGAGGRQRRCAGQVNVALIKATLATYELFRQNF